MSGDFSFNSTGVEPSRPRDNTPVPEGWYRAQITEVEMKDAKKAGNRYAEFVWTFLGGEFNGRKVWDICNVVNSNPTAQEIAHKDLAAICHATGVLKFGSLQLLKNHPCEIFVIVEKQQGYADKNVVKGYRTDPGVSRPAPRQAAPVTAGAQDEDDDSLPF